MILEEVTSLSTRFDELFNTAVEHYYKTSATQQDVPKEYALSVWYEMCDYSNSVYLKDKSTGAELFCVYKAGQYSPHYVGEGLSVIAMFSTSYSTRLYRTLYRFLISKAKEFECTWLNTNHKVREGVYEDKYKRI